ERSLGREVVAPVQQRDRPQRSEAALLRRRATADGETIAVLEDAGRPGACEQLSPVALYAWERLDGAATLAELTDACRLALGESAAAELPQAVSRLIAGGFARAKELRADVAGAMRRPSLAERLRRLFS